MNSEKSLGERFLPDLMKGAIALEHLHRYCFALQFVGDREVLDIASGEGYGSAMLATRSKRVIGVDIDEGVIEQARARYSGAGLAFQQGSCASIPLANASVDVVVSFETIEHHNQHEEMLDEIKRVLRPAGLLVISSPDKFEYSDRPGFSNPFHVLELYAGEFEQLLRSRFKHVLLLRQRVLAGSWLLQDEANASLEFFDASTSSGPAARLTKAPYLVAVASDSELPSIAGGVLEEDVLQLAAPVIQDANRRATALIRALAAPDSNLLRQSLDDEWYLRTNVDLTAEGLDRHAHWMANGADEGRLPAEDLVALARGLVAEQLGNMTERRSDASTPLEFGHLAKLEVLLEQLKSDKEYQYPEQVRSLHDRLESEGQAAAEREAGLQAKLAAASERERHLQRQLEDELTRSQAERAREAALQQELAVTCEQLRADLKAAQDLHRVEIRGMQAASAQAEQALQSRLGELTALLNAALAREQAACALREEQLKDLERGKADLLSTIASMEAQFKQRALEREAMFQQLLLEMQSGMQKQVAETERALSAQLATLAAEFGDQVQEMQASFRAQEAEREGRHRQELLQAADKLSAVERERAEQVAEAKADAFARELATEQAKHLHAMKEAALLNELASARNELVAFEAASQQQAKHASIERQALLDTAQELQTRLSLMQSSASWRWTAPFRALRRGESSASKGAEPTPVSLSAPAPRSKEDGPEQ